MLYATVMERDVTSKTFDIKWKCSWFPECNAPCQSPCRNPAHTRQKCAAYGLHELKDCSHGKWGFYYSSNGDIRTWKGVHRYNPSGCVAVYLLVYNRDKQQFLFDCNKRNEYNFPSHRRLTSEPEDLYEVAKTLLTSLFLPGNQHVSLTCIPRRFIFTDASVIYPACLNNDSASKLIFKSGRKWFDRKAVEQAMEAVTLQWALKVDKHSYGYEVKDRGAKLGQRPVFSLVTLVLRWLTENQSVETSRASSPSLSLASNSICSSVSFGISNTTSAYASASASVADSSTFDEPDHHVTLDEFFEL